MRRDSIIRLLLDFMSLCVYGAVGARIYRLTTNQDVTLALVIYLIGGSIFIVLIRVLKIVKE